MRRLLALALLLPGCLALAVLSVSPVHAISATCLPDGFPSTPTPPVFGMDIAAGGYSPTPTEFYHLDLWRVACQDGSGLVVLIRITPQSEAPRVCGYDFKILQRGQTTAAIRQTPDGYGFCDELLVPVTFVLDSDAYYGGPAFDPAGVLTLAIEQFFSTTASSRYAKLEVPAADGAFGISVVSTGCNPCSAGQTATFHIHVVNPGPPIDVALKAGLRLPNNGTFSLLGAQAEEAVVLESGEFDIPLASIVVPGDAPNGTYIVEVAVLEPVFGGTLSRHAVSVTKQ